MTYQYITYEKKEHVAYLTLNRPERLNAVCPPMRMELWDALRGFQQDPEAWVVILVGAGDRAFCAGADLKWRSEHPEGPQRPNYNVDRSFLPTEIWKPMIAAVNGYAVGGGMEITLQCDIIVATESAQFGVPEIRHNGGFAGAGGVLRLPRQIPYKIAMWMILSGQFMSARDMHRVGYVNEVVPPDKLMETAERYASALCEPPPIGVQTSKEVALRSLNLPVDYPPTAWQYQWEAITARMRGSEDAQESRQAWLEKRKPVYHNR